MGYPKLGIIIASFWFAAKHYHTDKLRNTYQPYSKVVKLFSFCPKCVQFKKKMDSKDKAFLSEWQPEKSTSILALLFRPVNIRKTLWASMDGFFLYK